MNGIRWIGLLALPAQSIPRGQKDASSLAWQAWGNGDIARAEELALQVPGDQGRHLQFLTASVTGRYEEAVALHAAIQRSYRRYRELDLPLIEVYVHLGRYAEALRFAHARRMDRNVVDALAVRAQHALTVTLEKTSVIPFAEQPLAPYFPAVQMEINGRTLQAHVDTGGMHLVMSPDRARQLGIDLVSVGRFTHYKTKSQWSRGLARTLRLGDAAFENVPVAAVPTLVGDQDFVIFGTNILEPFLATLDYRRQRLLLSPRARAGAVEDHWKLLPGQRTEVPFYLWGDHYLFARGGMGNRRDLNFFVDTGMVFLTSDEKGGSKQAAFMARAREFVSWGVPQADVRKKFFDSPLPLSLGPVTRAGLTFMVEDKPSWASIGGVRIDGVISHAFLSAYAWTLDFDRHLFVFSR
jgi:predicted aspartyl protease